MKKKLATTLSVVLILGLAVLGILAYLTDTAEDVNVMTLGNVQIEQHEYQRATDEDGTYKTATIDNRNSYVLEDFEQAKPLMPAVIPNGGTVGGTTWDYDSTTVRMTQVGSYGNAQVFNTPNAQDKFVTVENTGESDAYVRTLIALEVGDATIVDEAYPNQPLIGSEIRAAKEEYNANGKQPWTYGYSDYVNIDGNNYLVYELIYTGAMTSNGWKHENGVLPAGETTYPNLCQVYLASRATNDDVEKLDGNNNGTYDILVLSQAVQAEGFADAKTALDTAFGKTKDNAAEWFKNVIKKNTSDEWDGTADTSWYADTTATEYVLDSAEDVAGFAALVNGGNGFSGKTVKLDANVDLSGYEWTPIGQTGTSYGATTYFQGSFDGQGYTINGMTITNTNAGEHYAAGFFGFIDAADAEIKNVNFNNAKVAGHHWTGVVAGYITGSISGCEVTNSTVVCTHANDDACGDKAGVITGYVNSGTVTGNTVKDCAVTAGRDGGQVAGAAKTTQVYGNTIANVSVTAAGDCTGANINNAEIGRIL